MRTYLLDVIAYVVGCLIIVAITVAIAIGWLAIIGMVARIIGWPDTAVLAVLVAALTATVRIRRWWQQRTVYTGPNEE